ncbi:MAG: transcription termination factor NusA [Candidatus Onthovivens sp.]|nr:transcription termination factor NusA [Candidatus Onthovivens sp.]
MKKKEQKLFLEAVKAFEQEKGISSEILLDALNESFKFAFQKKIEKENFFDKKTGKSLIKVDKNAPKLPDALVRVDIDLDKARIKCFRQWLVLEDDDITDDYIEISIEDAREKSPKIKIGEYYEEELNLDDLNTRDADILKTHFKQKISKAEKEALMANFQNKIGTIVTGDVEKADRRCVIVNLGKTSATLLPGDLIGDEKYNTGDTIKVYIKEIGKDEKRGGSLVKISRSDPGFLRCLFENEIHEIYDGTVIIKDIARLAGKRSKVAVYSNDPNVDPSGACIGQNASRIQSIVSQLGNARDAKEKIDVITYNPNLGIYLSEILKPGNIVGAKIDEGIRTIYAIVESPDQKSLAIGNGGTNTILARQLTHFDKVLVKTVEEAEAENIDYKTMEEFEAEAREEERRRFRERQEMILNMNKPQVEEETTVKEEIKEEAPATVAEETKVVEPTVEVAPVVETPAVEVVAEKPVEETVEIVKKPAEPEQKVEIKKVEKPIEPEELREVKTTTTIESLEKILEQEKKEKEAKAQKALNKKKKAKKFEDEDDEKEEKKIIQKMDIYTDEELAELENEELDSSYEDEDDYSEYDDDNYYEE